ncbi:zinc finger, CCHC-type containing protein [Tanacetum coccineum]
MIHFLLSSMSVVYVLTTPMPEDGGDDATVEQIRKRANWDNDDYVCRDSLEAKYMAKDASSKKFLVSNFTNYKMADSRPVLKQYNELLDFKYTLKHLEEELTLVELGGHLRIEESLKMQDSDKPKGNNVADPSVVNMDDDVAWWVDSGAIVHVCKDRYLFKTYESLNNGSILHMINESTALVHGRGCVDLKLNIGNDNITSAFMSTSKLNDLILWHARLGHVHFKRMQHMSKDELILPFDMDTVKVPYKRNRITPYELWTKRKPNLNCLRVWGYRAVVRLHDSKLKTLGKRGMECIFVGYVEHSNAFRFYVIEPNDSVSINSIIESNDVIFDENKFSSVPKLSLRIPNGTEDIGGSVVPEEVTEKVVQQPESELRKTKRNRNPKNFRPEFQLYLIEGTRDEVSYQHSNCFNIEDDSKTFDEAMKSQDVAFWKEAINDEIDSIMGNKTWVLADLPPGCKPLAANGSLKEN